MRTAVACLLCRTADSQDTEQPEIEVKAGFEIRASGIAISPEESLIHRRAWTDTMGKSPDEGVIMTAQGAVPLAMHGTTGQVSYCASLVPAAPRPVRGTSRFSCAVVSPRNASATGIRGTVSPPAG